VYGLNWRCFLEGRRTTDGPTVVVRFNRKHAKRIAGISYDPKRNIKLGPYITTPNTRWGSQCSSLLVSSFLLPREEVF
jgi:hypothetical protein